MKCYRSFRLAPNLPSPQKHINSDWVQVCRRLSEKIVEGSIQSHHGNCPNKMKLYMYLHKSEWGGLYGIFGFEQSFLSCPWCVQLFLTRTRYKVLINFVLANPNYLYPQFSNSFQLMTGKEMETKVKSLFLLLLLLLLFCFFTLAIVCRVH